MSELLLNIVETVEKKIAYFVIYFSKSVENLTFRQILSLRITTY